MTVKMFKMNAEVVNRKIFWKFKTTEFAFYNILTCDTNNHFSIIIT